MGMSIKQSRGPTMVKATAWGAMSPQPSYTDGEPRKVTTGAAQLSFLEDNE